MGNIKNNLLKCVFIVPYAKDNNIKLMVYNKEEKMKYIIGVVGLIVILALAWIGSSDKKNIKYKPVFLMHILQFVLGFILLNTQVGNYLVGSIANGFQVLLDCAGDGVNFVFGGLVNNDQFSFFISVLLPIIFISA